MARAGLFNDLDVCLIGTQIMQKNKANMQSSQAIADYTITSKKKVLMQQQILERSERIRCSYLLLELIS
jgi:hypothetical protein